MYEESYCARHGLIAIIDTNAIHAHLVISEIRKKSRLTRLEVVVDYILFYLSGIRSP